MAEYTLTLDNLKFANVTGFTRPYGTKKQSNVNGGSLTTEEFNIANALPWDMQRPLTITESSVISNIQYDANIVVNASGSTLTINTGTYIGVKVKVYAKTACNILHDTNITDALLEGDRVTYEWNGTGWDCVGSTPLGKLNYTSMCTTALATNKAVSISGFTLKDGVTVEVFFVNGHYVSSASDAFTLNINALGAKKIYVCKDGSQILMPNHSIERSESGDSTAHNWYIQPNTTLKLMYLSSLDSGNGGFVILGNPIVLSSSDYIIYSDGFNEIEFANNQNELSDWYDFYTYNENSWIMPSAPYDGFVSAISVGGQNMGVKIVINDTIIFATATTSAWTQDTIVTPFKKGDKINLTTSSSYPSVGYVCFYEKRTYANR